MKRSLCKHEGCNNPAFSKGLCKNHMETKPLSSYTRLKPRGKKEEIRINHMHLFFKQIWDERKHRSEVSGTSLGKEPLSTFFHHILPKSKYPEMAYMKSNIILLTLEEHDNVESDMYRYEEVNKRREKLIELYERTKQRAQDRN